MAHGIQSLVKCKRLELGCATMDRGIDGRGAPHPTIGRRYLLSWAGSGSFHVRLRRSITTTRKSPASARAADTTLPVGEVIADAP